MLLLMDEFTSLQRMQQFEDSIAFLASYGVTQTMIRRSQSVSADRPFWQQQRQHERIGKRIRPTVAPAAGTVTAQSERRNRLGRGLSPCEGEEDALPRGQAFQGPALSASCSTAGEYYKPTANTSNRDKEPGAR